ncbi:SHD1 domain-containing protein [Rubritalea marina]|uniref:SHD1 domain-containing protein n=1 Tax=Rubritalea marina TaxID=361055 RepID=UPI0003813E9C|nr:SHD1 domain-containing protein [Rubritalea marina]
MHGTFKSLFLIALSLAFVCELSARTWTNRKGKLIEAEMLGVEGDKVKLLMKGKTFKVPIKSLSPEDQSFIDSWEPEEEAQSSGAAEVEASFAQTWPKLVTLDLEVVIEEKVQDDGSYIYTSPNYAFYANTKLGKSVVKRFAVLFEATRQYVQRLPLASMKASKQGEKYKIYLFDTESDYFKAGGPQGSAGVYIGSKGIILVQCESLGLVRRSNSWAVDYGRTNKTLPHEITHQLMDEEYYAKGSMGWFTEGIAEYVAVTPYRSGKFVVSRQQRNIEQYVTSFSKQDNRGRNIGTDILMPDLLEYMMLPYEDFVSTPQKNYGVAALLVTYFCHFDGEGDAANLKNFLRALKAGKTGEDAIQALLAGRSMDALEADILREWKKRGVTIRFQ